MNKKLQAFLSVFTGVITMLLSGLVLSPLVKWILVNCVPPAFKQLSVTENLLFCGLLFLWVGIPAFLGGFVAARIATGRNIFYALLAGLTSFVLFLCLTTYGKSSFTSFAIIAGSLELVVCSLIGGIIQQKIALRKYETI